MTVRTQATPGGPFQLGLFRACDTAAINAKRGYLGLIAAELACGLLAAALLLLPGIYPGARGTVAILVAGLFGTGVLLTTVLLLGRQRDAWYLARVGAESTKSLIWRYMMAVEPYPADLPIEIAREQLRANLRDVLVNLREIGDRLAGHGSELFPDQSIDSVRVASIETKWQTYVRERLVPQAIWYRRKAKRCRRHAQTALVLMAGCQVAGVVLALVAISAATVPLDLSGFLIVGAAACLSWMEARQDAENAQRYGLVSHELSLAHVTPHSVAGLVAAIQLAEGLISREHATWSTERLDPAIPC